MKTLILLIVPAWLLAGCCVESKPGDSWATCIKNEGGNPTSVSDDDEGVRVASWYYGGNVPFVQIGFSSRAMTNGTALWVKYDMHGICGEPRP